MTPFPGRGYALRPEQLQQVVVMITGSNPRAVVLVLSVLASCPACVRPAAAQVLAPEVNRNLSCLARNVYHEARGEPVAGMVAVAQVVVNRARDGRDLCSVIYERAAGRCQFSWTCHPGLALREHDAYRQSQAVASAVGGSTATPRAPDPTGGATEFRTCNGWNGGGEFRLTARIGTHCFYRRRDSPDEQKASGAFDLVESQGEGGYRLVVTGSPGAREFIGPQPQQLALADIPEEPASVRLVGTPASRSSRRVSRPPGH